MGKRASVDADREMESRSLAPATAGLPTPHGRVEGATPAWSGLATKHRVSVAHGDPVVTEAELPHVRLVSSLLKRWLLGTHHGSVGSGHLREYLDEFGSTGANRGMPGNYPTAWPSNSSHANLLHGSHLSLGATFQARAKCRPRAADISLTSAIR